MAARKNALTMTRRLAWSAATDAGNASMRAAGRKVWSAEDQQVAAREFERLWPISAELRQRQQNPKRRVSLKKARPAARRGKRNPDAQLEAAQLSEQFHGRPAKQARDYEQDQAVRRVLADLGRLLEITAETPDGQQLKLRFRGVRLASSPDGGQLYFLGNDQEVPLEMLGLADGMPKDQVVIGEALSIVYHTQKGFHDFEPTDYEHEFGEESGVRPTLCYDVLNRRPYLVGGNYQVRPEGITD